MTKPVIMTVDDDREVLQAVSRDLKQQYGDRFRIVRADSGAAAFALAYRQVIEATQKLKLRNEPVALFLVDR
jgi:thioredoxin reductase (NADPH)